jgi:oxalate---CoA ligase
MGSSERDYQEGSNALPHYYSFQELFHVMRGMSSAAVRAPGRPPLSYARLCVQIEEVLDFLNCHGLGRESRIAAILQNGPEMAVLFLCGIAGSAFVPLAPDYTEREFDAYFSDLNVSALVVTSGHNLNARSVAVRKNIPVIEMMPLKGEAAGLFRLAWETGDRPKPAQIGFSGQEDIALVLATSGTTSRAKVVPLRQKNVLAAAWYIASTLELTAADCCLNIMPMYHITGLISPVLASVLARGSVLCTPGFPHNDFESWLRLYSATWYSAVPIIHQAIADKADQAAWDLKGTSIRFVRSTSSPLSEALFLRLEQLFGVPVVQSYGLTEALPVSSTPLNPYRRKPASVGIPVSDITIMDDCGLPLGCGDAGEILVRGPQVFSGYHNYPEANESVFSDGWFRTGDMGYLDEENYLYVTGRIKEMINRGGQKVSPGEVETALTSHPAVQEVAVFGIPHDRLGEAVVAAVVLKDEAQASEADLLRHAAKHLAPFKIPQQIITVSGIPKGPTGKFRRSDLSEHFRELLNPVFALPVTETEKTIAKIWSNILKIETLSRNENFFSLGGDSLSAIDMLFNIEKALGVALPPSTIYEATTIERLAEEVERRRQHKTQSCLVSLRTGGSRLPLICVPPINGGALVYHSFLKYIDPDQPVYSIESSEDALQTSMEEAAGRFLAEIRQKMNNNKFLLLGFSSGGLMAFEIARQLYQKGQSAPFLGILDTSCLPYVAGRIQRSALERITDFVKNLPYWIHHYLPFWLRHYYYAVTGRMKGIFRDRMHESQEHVYELSDEMPKVIEWLHRYVPQRFPAHVTFYRAQAQGLLLSYPDMGWGCVADMVRVRPVPGTHVDILKEPYVRWLASRVNEDLRSVTEAEEQRVD